MEIHLSNSEMFDINFGHILEDPEDDMYKESMDLIRSIAVDKKIEFDGYFQQRWEDSANTIINFDEEYFEDPDRTELYVHLSALVDDEIYLFLIEVYRIVNVQIITKDFIQERIEYLTKEKGVKF